VTELRDRSFVGGRIYGTWKRDDPTTADSFPAYTAVMPGLYLGGHPIEGLPDGVDVVVNVDSVRYYEPPAGAIYVAYPFEDTDTLPDLVPLRLLAEQIVALRSAGLTVFVHCRLGLNRSALLVALVLIGFGLTADDAIRYLRTKRHPRVLCNEVFERALLLGGE
jgi:protein-tyrosine phosphatase